MFYTYFQHKINRIPGAYTTYAFYEWSLIAADLLFDSIFISDLANVYIHTSNSNEATGVTLQPKFNKPGDNGDVQVEAVRTHLLRHYEWFMAFDLRVRNIMIVLNYAANTVLSLIWWTNFTALPLCIFYYSVWSLSFAGQEGLILVTLSASLITLKNVRVFASSPNGKAVLTAISLLGVFASKLEFPVLKLAAGECYTQSNSFN